MEKIKEYKVIIILVSVLILILGTFYWFQLRPTLIKKNCSWFTKTIKVDAGVTKEQAFENKKGYEQCSAKGGSSVDCFVLKLNSIERPFRPEKEITIEATNIQYDMCLRLNGL